MALVELEQIVDHLPVWPHPLGRYLCPFRYGLVASIVSVAHDKSILRMKTVPSPRTLEHNTWSTDNLDEQQWCDRWRQHGVTVFDEGA